MNSQEQEKLFQKIMKNQPTQKGNNRISGTGVCGVQKTNTARYRAFYKRVGMKVEYGKSHIGIKKAALDRQGFENKYGKTPSSNVDKWLREN